MSGLHNVDLLSHSCGQRNHDIGKIVSSKGLRENVSGTSFLVSCNILPSLAYSTTPISAFLHLHMAFSMCVFVLCVCVSRFSLFVRIPVLLG